MKRIKTHNLNADPNVAKPRGFDGPTADSHFDALAETTSSRLREAGITLRAMAERVKQALTPAPLDQSPVLNWATNWTTGKTIESVGSQRLRATGKQEIEDMTGLLAALLEKAPGVKRVLGIHGALAIQKTVGAGLLTMSGVGIGHMIGVQAIPDSLLHQAEQMIVQTAHNLGIADYVIGSPAFTAGLLVSAVTLAMQISPAKRWPGVHENRAQWVDRLQGWQDKLQRTWLGFTASWLKAAENKLFSPLTPLSPASQQRLAKGDRAATREILPAERETWVEVVRLFTRNFGAAPDDASLAASELLGRDGIDANVLRSTLLSRAVPQEWIAAYGLDPDRCIVHPEQNLALAENEPSYGPAMGG
ncbi:hypothetical protein [Geopseudomonas aromaticivorans]